MKRAALEALAERFPTIGRAQAEIAALRASLLLPRPVVHVLSDVHGEYGKLRHVLNNVSGRLRPLVEQIFAGRLTELGVHPERLGELDEECGLVQRTARA